MTEIHDDFIKAAAALMRAGATAGALATALQKQYRDGFKAGQREGEEYQRRQNNHRD